MKNCFITNPVNLKKLIHVNLDQNKDFILVLRDDIWKKGILLLRRGRYLTDDVVSKLLNFGIYEVNVHLLNEQYDEKEYSIIEGFKSNFIKTQNILIIQESFRDISFFAQIFKRTGFEEGNIYASTDMNLLNKYFESKEPVYLVMPSKFLKDFLKKNIYKLNNVRNIHIFIDFKAEEYSRIQDSLIKYSDIDFKLVSNPLIVNHMKDLLYQCIDSDFVKLLKNKKDKEQKIKEIA